MSYSFTEKKRIRKSFATRPSVLEVPSLLETQLRSYEVFLQADVKPESRKMSGCSRHSLPFSRSPATTATPA